MLKHEQPPDNEQKLRVVQIRDSNKRKAKTPRLDMVRVQKTNNTGNRPSLFVFTLHFIYKNLYILGATLLRRKRRYARKARLFFSKQKGSVYAGLYHLSRAVRRFFSQILSKLKAPFLRIRSAYREQKPIIRAKREKGIIPFSSYLDVVEAVARLLGRIASTIVNHIAPAAAVLILAFLINSFVNQTFGLEVVYEGEVIGYIKNEAEFDAAARDVKSRTIAESDYTYTTEVPSYELVICENTSETNRWIVLYNQLLKQAGIKLVELEGFTPREELADSIIRASGRDVENAYGLYIDNRFYGAVMEKDGLLNSLESLKKRSTLGKPDEQVEFEKSIQFTKKGLYLSGSIVEEQDLLNVLTSYESGRQVYIVEENDTPTGIADKTGVSYSRLKEMNPGIEESLQVGDEIITAVERPFLSVKSIYTDVYQEEVDFEVEEIQNAIYAKGYEEITQEGVPGIREVTTKVTAINGMEAARVEISSREIKAPVPQKVIVGVNTPMPAINLPGGSSGGTSTDMTPKSDVSSTGFISPVSGYISCYLGGYAGHTGIDIAGPAGSPVYASASGTVTLAKKTYYGYGIYCIINHGNGYETLYAHNSALYVSVGDYVTQGQVIAARGRTGNASGNHVHFEIRYNGSIRNPINYISVTG